MSKSKKNSSSKTKTPAKSTKTVAKDPRVEKVYEEWVEFNCPIRGKVKQKVKVKRYKPPTDIQMGKQFVTISDAIGKIEEKDDGFSIYGELEVEGEE